MADNFKDNPFADCDDDIFGKTKEDSNKNKISQKIPKLSDIINILSENREIKTSFENKKDNDYTVITKISEDSGGYEYQTENPIGINKNSRLSNKENAIKAAAESHLNICDDVLKHNKKQRIRKMNKILIIISFFIAIFFIIFFLKDKEPPIRISIKELIIKLENGDFKTVENIIQKYSKRKEFNQFKEQLNFPLEVDVQFEFWKVGQLKPKKYPADSAIIKNTVLNSEDQYKLYIKLPQNTGSLYLYVFQKDYKGIYILLPDAEWSKVVNPVKYGQKYHIPPEYEEGAGWITLDKSYSDSPEMIYVIASPWEAKDIQKKYKQIEKETDKNKRKFLIEKFVDRLKLRRDSNIKSVYYEEFSFIHGASH